MPKAYLRRVLVVEDESLLRWALVETLTVRGHGVMQAADGAAALRAVQDAPNPFDTVLLDYCLPDGNDFALLVKIRLRSPTTAVVLMVPYDNRDAAEGARRAGAVEVLTKPFDMDVLHLILIGTTGA